MASIGVVHDSLFHSVTGFVSSPLPYHHRNQKPLPIISNRSYCTSSDFVSPPVLITSTTTSNEKTTKKEEEKKMDKKKMPMKKTTASDSTFTAESRFLKLLNRSCKAGNYDEALYFLESMATAGHSPGAALCTKVIKGFTSSPMDTNRNNSRNSFKKKKEPVKLVNLRKAERVMEILELYGKPDIFVYTTLLAAFCKSSQFDSAISLLKRMELHNCIPDIVTYNILISWLCSKGRLQTALDTFFAMLQSGHCQPTDVTYTMLIQASITEGGISDATKFLEDMSAAGIAPSVRTHNAILRGLCEKGLVDKAWQLARSLANPPNPSNSSSTKSTALLDVVSYHILLKGLLCMKRWEDADVLLAEMLAGEEQRRPNVVTYSILIRSMCWEGMVDKAVRVMEDMVKRGVKPDSYCYDPMISACCWRGRMDLAVAFMERKLAAGCMPDMVNYNLMLGSLCKSGWGKEAAEILWKMDEKGFSLDTMSYNVVIWGLWASGERGMAFEMLEEMLEKGLEADEVTYSTLISCLCRDGMVDAALELSRIMMEGPASFRPDVITYNTLLLGLCKARRIDEAIELFASHMMMDHRGNSRGNSNNTHNNYTPRIEPNDATYVILVKGIAIAGYASEALCLCNALLSCDVVSADSFFSTT